MNQLLPCIALYTLFIYRKNIFVHHKTYTLLDFYIECRIGWNYKIVYTQSTADKTLISDSVQGTDQPNVKAFSTKPHHVFNQPHFQSTKEKNQLEAQLAMQFLTCMLKNIPFRYFTWRKIPWKHCGKSNFKELSFKVFIKLHKDWFFMRLQAIEWIWNCFNYTPENNFTNVLRCLRTERWKSNLPDIQSWSDFLAWASGLDFKYLVNRVLLFCRQYEDLTASKKPFLKRDRLVQARFHFFLISRSFCKWKKSLLYSHNSLSYVEQSKRNN